MHQLLLMQALQEVVEELAGIRGERPHYGLLDFILERLLGQLRLKTRCFLKKGHALLSLKLHLERLDLDLLLLQAEVGQEVLAAQLEAGLTLEADPLCFLGVRVKHCLEQLLLRADLRLAVSVRVAELIRQQVLSADHLVDISLGHEHLLWDDLSQLGSDAVVPPHQRLIHELNFELRLLLVAFLHREDAYLLKRLVQGVEELLSGRYELRLAKEGLEGGELGEVGVEEEVGEERDEEN